MQVAGNTIEVKFWGVRGSYPVPGPGTLRYGGNTPCVQVRLGGYQVLLDFGTGAIPLGRELVQRAHAERRPLHALALLSHYHHDHTQAFPFFAPLRLSETCLHLYGPGDDNDSVRQRMAAVISPPAFPLSLSDLPAQLTFNTFPRGQALVLDRPGSEPRWMDETALAALPNDALRVRWMYSPSHPHGVAIYRLDWRGRSVVYATDTEGCANLDRRLVEFARGADLLIHDAQYTDAHYLGQATGFPAVQGWGHSTPRMACDVAEAAGVARLALFHYEPQYDDDTLDGIVAGARRRLPGVIGAREGLNIVISTTSSLNIGDTAYLGRRTPGD